MPGQINLRYDIDGDDPKAEFFLQLSPSPFPDLSAVQKFKVDNKSHLDIKGVTPGSYDLAKIRELNLVARQGWVVFGDRRMINVKAGESVTVDFVRDRGARVSIEVDGLEPLGVSDAKILIYRNDIRLVKGPGALFEGLVDALIYDRNGRCQTPKLLPGTYTIVAEVYRPAPKEGGFLGGLIGADYRATALVEVPRVGEAPRVRIEMPKPPEAK